jgi:hypothetical protein
MAHSSFFLSFLNPVVQSDLWALEPVRPSARPSASPSKFCPPNPIGLFCVCLAVRPLGQCETDVSTPRRLLCGGSPAIATLPHFTATDAHVGRERPSPQPISFADVEGWMEPSTEPEMQCLALCGRNGRFRDLIIPL